MLQNKYYEINHVICFHTKSIWIYIYSVAGYRISYYYSVARPSHRPSDHPPCGRFPLPPSRLHAGAEYTLESSRCKDIYYGNFVDNEFVYDCFW